MQYKKIKLLVALGLVTLSRAASANQDGLDFTYCSTPRLNPDVRYMVMNFKKETPGYELPAEIQLFSAHFIDTFNRKNIKMVCSRYLSTAKNQSNVEFYCEDEEPNAYVANQGIRVQIYREHRVGIITFGPYDLHYGDNTFPMFCE